MDTHDVRPSEPVVAKAAAAMWPAAYAESGVSSATHPPPSAAAPGFCDADDPDAAAIEAFFAASAPADGAAEGELAVPAMSAGSRRAMWVALSSFALSSLMIGGFVVYNRFVMPVPVELGAVHGANELETSVSSASTPALQPSAAQAKPPTFDEWLQVAQSFADEGQDKRALDAFERALALAPGAAPALAGKAQAHLKLNEREAAKDFAALAVRADPRNGLGWMILGSAEEQLGAGAAAQEAYRHCADQAEGAYVPECRKLLR